MTTEPKKLQHLVIPAGKCPIPFPVNDEEGAESRVPSDEAIREWGTAVRRKLQAEGYVLAAEGLSYWVRSSFPTLSPEYNVARERINSIFGSK